MQSLSECLAAKHNRTAQRVSAIQQFVVCVPGVALNEDIAKILALLRAEQDRDVQCALIAVLVRSMQYPFAKPKDVIYALLDLESMVYSHDSTRNGEAVVVELGQFRAFLWHALSSICLGKGSALQMLVAWASGNGDGTHNPDLPPSSSYELPSAVALCELPVFVRSLADRDPRVRCAALRFLATHSATNKEPSSTSAPRVDRDRQRSALFRVRLEGMHRRLQNTMTHAVCDPHASVRLQALVGLLQLHRRGMLLVVSVFPFALRACECTEERNEQIRCNAIILMWTLAHLYPDHAVPSSSGFSSSPSVLSSQTLLHAAFVQTCVLCTDVSIAVRTAACTLIGLYCNVNLAILSQIFLKKALRQEASLLPLAPAAAPGSMGLQPVLLWEALLPFETTPLDAAGAVVAAAGGDGAGEVGWAGAIIHGIEDQFLEVRSAAIDAVVEVALSAQPLMTQAVECLVDMFNDESDTVRVNAIFAVSRLGGSARLIDQYMQTVLTMMEDKALPVRAAIYHFISRLQQSSLVHLAATVNALVNSLKVRFKHVFFQADQALGEEMSSIYSCFAAVGRRHAPLMHFLIKQLLNYNSLFDPPVPSLTDISYIGVLSMVYHSSLASPALINSLPSYTPSHFRACQANPLVARFFASRTSPLTGSASQLSRAWAVSATFSTTLASVALTDCVRKLSRLCLFPSSSTAPPILSSVCSDSLHHFQQGWQSWSSLIAESWRAAQRAARSFSDSDSNACSADGVAVDFSLTYSQLMQAIATLVAQQRASVQKSTGVSTDSNVAALLSSQCLTLVQALLTLYLGLSGPIRAHLLTLYFLCQTVRVCSLSTLFISNVNPLVQTRRLSVAQLGSLCLRLQSYGRNHCSPSLSSNSNLSSCSVPACASLWKHSSAHLHWALDALENNSLLRLQSTAQLLLPPVPVFPLCPHSPTTVSLERRGFLEGCALKKIAALLRYPIDAIGSSSSPVRIPVDRGSGHPLSVRLALSCRIFNVCPSDLALLRLRVRVPDREQTELFFESSQWCLSSSSSSAGADDKTGSLCDKAGSLCYSLDTVLDLPLLKTSTMSPVSNRGPRSQSPSQPRNHIAGDRQSAAQMGRGGTKTGLSFVTSASSASSSSSSSGPSSSSSGWAVAGPSSSHSSDASSVQDISNGPQKRRVSALNSALNREVSGIKSGPQPGNSGSSESGLGEGHNHNQQNNCSYAYSVDVVLLFDCQGPACLPPSLSPSFADSSSQDSYPPLRQMHSIAVGPAPRVAPNQDTKKKRKLGEEEEAWAGGRAWVPVSKPVPFFVTLHS